MLALEQHMSYETVQSEFDIIASYTADIMLLIMTV